MNYEEFSRRAHRIFDDIPPEYREGVDGLEVTRRTAFHPTLPEVYTLGECLSEFYPTDFGGAGEVRSRVVLYYGSFLALSRTRDDWDWEEELFETVMHEVRHHLESLAQEDALEEMDYAEDQNFARREGESFDPFFFHSGHAVAPGIFEVDGDLFVERPIDARTFERERELAVELNGDTVRVPLPAELGDVHYLNVTDAPGEGSGEVFVVLVRRRGPMEWLRRLLGGRSLTILETEVKVAPS
jgi:predicted Zn-dependent protease with MMP-like domain